MAKNDLLKDAIADAKTVRNTALANAKAALEEAFTPKLKSMISAKLTEELEEEKKDEMKEMGYDEPVDEDIYEGDYMDEAEDKGEEANEEVMDEEISLEEILAELELEEATDDPEKMEGKKPSKEKKEKEEMDEEIDLNELMLEIEANEDINLNELLYELEEEKETKEEIYQSGGGEGAAAGVAELARMLGVAVDKLKGAKIPEKLSNILGLKDPKGYKQSGAKYKNPDLSQPKMEAELNEAYKVIQFQKSKLNEVNVLNSKLLYVNKLFKTHNLNENQKIKVVDSLDQADSAKEAKLIYNTLNEAFSSVRSQIKESVKAKSFASKATGVLKENKISKAPQEDETTLRWKKLANIN